MQPMSEDDVEGRLAQIRDLRTRGEITPAEAYELHMKALSTASTAVAAIATPPTSLTWPSFPEAPAAPVAAGRRLGLDILAVTLAVVGGVLGIIGAIFQELQAGAFAVFAAPIIEEALKPAGIYILLVRWPQALRGQLHTAALTALSGLCFAIIEAFVYVTLYFPEGDSDFVLFRFTVPLSMHVVASFIVGLGLSRAVIDWASKGGRFPKRTRNFLLAGMALHMVYNIAAVALSVAGVLEFEARGSR
jgi:hypothetical protein